MYEDGEDPAESFVNTSWSADSELPTDSLLGAPHEVEPHILAAYAAGGDGGEGGAGVGAGVGDDDHMDEGTTLRPRGGGGPRTSSNTSQLSNEEDDEESKLEEGGESRWMGEHLAEAEGSQVESGRRIERLLLAQVPRRSQRSRGSGGGDEGRSAPREQADLPPSPSTRYSRDRGISLADAGDRSVSHGDGEVEEAPDGEAVEGAGEEDERDELGEGEKDKEEGKEGDGEQGELNRGASLLTPNELKPPGTLEEQRALALALIKRAEIELYNSGVIDLNGRLTRPLEQDKGVNEAKKHKAEGGEEDADAAEPEMSPQDHHALHSASTERTRMMEHEHRQGEGTLDEPPTREAGEEASAGSCSGALTNALVLVDGGESLVRYSDEEGSEAPICISQAPPFVALLAFPDSNRWVEWGPTPRLEVVMVPVQLSCEYAKAGGKREDHLRCYVQLLVLLSPHMTLSPFVADVTICSLLEREEALIPNPLGTPMIRPSMAEELSEQMRSQIEADRFRIDGIIEAPSSSGDPTPVVGQNPCWKGGPRPRLPDTEKFQADAKESIRAMMEERSFVPLLAISKAEVTSSQSVFVPLSTHEWLSALRRP